MSIGDAAVCGSVRELTGAIASGDPEAFTHFFRTRFDEMYAEARRCTSRDEAFCLDVVQEAFVRLIRALKPLDTEEQLQAWLRVVVRSCAYDLLRKEARHRRREAAAAPADTCDTDPETQARLEWLDAELSRVGGERAALLTMRYRLGWTLRRIGEAVGLHPGAVDGRLGRTVETLRRRAQETYDD